MNEDDYCPLIPQLSVRFLKSAHQIVLRFFHTGELVVFQGNKYGQKLFRKKKAKKAYFFFCLAVFHVHIRRSTKRQPRIIWCRLKIWLMAFHGYKSIYYSNAGGP